LNSKLPDSNDDVERESPFARALDIMKTMKTMKIMKLLIVIGILVNLVPDLGNHWQRFDAKHLWNPVLKQDPVERFDRRVASLRAVIAPGETLGYVSDSISIGQFYQTQYALAPNLLLPLVKIPNLRMGPSASGRQPSRAVGIFYDASHLDRIRAKLSLGEPQPFAEGIYLFETQQQ